MARITVPSLPRRKPFVLKHTFRLLSCTSSHYSRRLRHVKRHPTPVHVPEEYRPVGTDRRRIPGRRASHHTLGLGCSEQFG